MARLRHTWGVWRAVVLACCFVAACAPAKEGAPASPDAMDAREVAGDLPAERITQPPDGLGDVDAAPPDVQWLIEEGKYWLSNAEPALARQSFLGALGLDPANREALFGAGLSEYVRSLELFGMIMTMPTQFVGYVGGDGNGFRAAGPPESENDFLAEQLSGLFVQLRAGFAEADGYFEQVAHPDFSWYIEQVPIYVLTRPVVSFRGEFDIADVYFLRSSAAFLLWFTEVLAAQDFHADMLTAFYLAEELQDQGIEVWGILSIVSKLMASDPRFLTLREDGGVEMFNEGAGHMRDCGEFFLEGLTLLEDPGRSGENHVTGLEYHQGDPVIVVRNRVDYDTGEEEALEIEFAAELVTAQEELLAALEMPGQVVPFSAGPAVQLGTVFGVLTRFGVLRFIPVELPLDFSDLQPAEVAGLLAVFLGDSIGFDYGSFLQNPTGLRSFFPHLNKEADATNAEDFWMEWECPGETAETGFPLKAQGFLCSSAAELEDSAHFVGTEYELEADGLASPLPYMVWEDPAWGGILGVDELYLVEGGDPAQFAVPDLWLVNLGVHLWLEPVLGLLR